jgi:hypothetical protein
VINQGGQKDGLPRIRQRHNTDTAFVFRQFQHP